MVEKMWALLIHHGEQIEVERASIFKSNVTSVDVGFEGKKEIKQITITDEDLFKNVREVLKERKPCLLDNELERLRILNDLRYKIMKAIQKDIANFDKGVK